MQGSRPIRRSLSILAALCLSAAPALAQDGDAGESIELVDQTTFRACADPRNLPFSNQAGEGFENKIAALFAAKLGRPLAYAFYPGATGFIRNTLNQHLCDVVLGVAHAADIVQPTNPYYRTAYVAATRKGGPLDGLDTLADPRLASARIGVIAATPPVTALATRGLLGQTKSYALVVDTRFDAATHELMDDLDAGVVDVAFLWGPIAGYYAQRAKNPIVVTPLVKETSGSPLVYRVAMGVRRADQNWKRTLNKLISDNRQEINAILLGYGVPLLDENNAPIKP